MKVKVNIVNNQTNISISISAKSLIRKACLETLKSESFPINAEVDITIVDDEQIKEYNNQYRNINKSTDVLSFPLGTDGEYDINPSTKNAMLGDVVISIDHAYAQADLFGHGISREIAYLTVHSMLHLLGYDHVNNEEEQAIMRNKEEIILKNLGLEIVKA